jgi:hypothetical protein
MKIKLVTISERPQESQTLDYEDIRYLNLNARCAIEEDKDGSLIVSVATSIDGDSDLMIEKVTTLEVYAKRRR